MRAVSGAVRLSDAPCTIVFLLHRAPYPLDKGEKIRGYQELASLARRGHRVHLIAFVDSERDARSAGALESMCASVHLVRRWRIPSVLNAGSRLVRGGPLSLGYFGSTRMARLVRDTLRRQAPDVVLAYSSGMGQFIPKAWWSRTVFDLVDADSEKWRVLRQEAWGPQRWILGIEAARLAQYEGEIVRRARTTLVSTLEEREVLCRNHGAQAAGRIRILMNAVDPAQFDPVPYRDSAAALELKRAAAVVFAGAMNYLPNVDAVCHFAQDILPVIRRRAAVEFWIVGGHPVRKVRRLTRNGAVRVTGYVDDVKPFLAAARVVVIPLRIARGVQNKLLEAMAMGCAVVCTPRVSAPVGATDGEHLLLAETPAAFADAVLRLVTDEDLRVELGRRAREFVLARHAPHTFEREIDETVADARFLDGERWHP